MSTLNHAFVTIFLITLPLISSIFAQSDCPLAELPVNMDNPDQIVGNGTAASCSQTAIQSALNVGGTILCNCGTQPVTLSSPLLVTQPTVLDGGGTLILDGQIQTRIMDKQSNIDLTVQNTTFRNGLAPGPSGHFTNECGGAILARGGGTLKVINCHFEDNTVTSTDGSDIAGGAVYVFGEQEGIFSGSTFYHNSASNGGAIGGLGSDIIIANCKFYGNGAMGTSGGLRGHGGAINLDGVESAAANKIYSVCGTEFIGNHAESQGGASNTVFSDNVGARLEIDQCYFEANFLRSGTVGNGGAIFHVVDDLAGGLTEQQFLIQRSTFRANRCLRQGGAVWALINGSGIVENCTFVKDSTLHPDHGLGGALIVSAWSTQSGGWTVRNNTFFENYAGLFGGGAFANPDAMVRWQNNILQQNSHSNTNPWVGLNVNRAMDILSGANLQWPQFRPNGSEDTRVGPTSVFMDADLETHLIYQGGPTPTLAIPPGNPIIQTGTGCPTTDQRLLLRSHCEPGAYGYETPLLPHAQQINGLQWGYKRYRAASTISLQSHILSGGVFSLEAADEVELQAGTTIAAGALLDINILTTP